MVEIYINMFYFWWQIIVNVILIELLSIWIKIIL